MGKKNKKPNIEGGMDPRKQKLNQNNPNYKGKKNILGQDGTPSKYFKCMCDCTDNCNCPCRYHFKIACTNPELDPKFCQSILAVAGCPPQTPLREPLNKDPPLRSREKKGGEGDGEVHVQGPGPYAIGESFAA